MSSTPDAGKSDVAIIVHSSSSGDLIPDIASTLLREDQTLSDVTNLRNCNTLPKCSPVVIRKNFDIKPLDSIRKVNSCDYFVDREDIYSVHSASFPCIKEKRKTSHGALSLQQYECSKKYNTISGKFNAQSETPSSANISSISLQSVKCGNSPSSSISSVFTSIENQEKPVSKMRTFSNRSLSFVDYRKPLNARAMSLNEKLSKNSPDDAPLEKLLPKANLAPAFEMNLDHSPPGENVNETTMDQFQSRRLSKPALYLSKVSPRALKKLNTQSKNEKRRKRSTVWFDQKVECDNDLSNSTSSDELLSHPKYMTSSSQTDLQGFTGSGVSIIRARSHNRNTWQVKPMVHHHSIYKAATWDSRQGRSKSIWGGTCKEAEEFKWSAPSETQYKTKLTIQIYNINDNMVEDEDVLRTPLKPAMGISMIGKQRRSSTLSDKLEGKSSIVGSPISLSTTTQATQTDSDEELTQLFDFFGNADFSFDDTNVTVRHKHYLTSPFDKQRTEQMLLLKHLEHTLKAKEDDLKAIECLLESTITSEVLLNWVKMYPHICPQYELPSAGEERDSESVI